MEQRKKLKDNIELAKPRLQDAITKKGEIHAILTDLKEKVARPNFPSNKEDIDSYYTKRAKAESYLQFTKHKPELGQELEKTDIQFRAPIEKLLDPDEELIKYLKTATPAPNIDKIAEFEALIDSITILNKLPSFPTIDLEEADKALVLSKKNAGLLEKEEIAGTIKETNFLLKELIKKLVNWIGEPEAAASDDASRLIFALLKKEIMILTNLIKSEPGDPDTQLLTFFKETFAEPENNKYNIAQIKAEVNADPVQKQKFDRAFEGEFNKILDLETAPGGHPVKKVIVSNAGFTFTRFGRDAFTPQATPEKTRRPTLYNLHNLRLCTLSTILDAAPYNYGGCTYMASQKPSVFGNVQIDPTGYEYASMYVKLESGPLFYDFQVKLAEGKEGKILNSVDATCNLPSYNTPPWKELKVDIDKNLHITAEKPSVAVILSKKTVYKKLVKKFIKLVESKSTASAPTGTVLWDSLSNDEEFITDLFNNISAKGLGDFSQELSTVLKYGAYIKKGKEEGELGAPKYDPYDLPVHRYDDNGNAWRIFVANDRPSAIRFMFMLLFFPQDSINQRASGGYLSSAEYVVAKPCPSLHSPPCAPPAAQGPAGPSAPPVGGSRKRSSKKLKDKQKNPKRKTKKFKRK